MFYGNSFVVPACTLKLRGIDHSYLKVAVGQIGWHTGVTMVPLVVVSPLMVPVAWY